jgi:hypothetical protein
MSQENTKRSIWSIHGLTGMLISIVGLLVIWAIMQLAVHAAYKQMTPKTYSAEPIRDLNNAKMIGDFEEQKKFSFVDAEK